MSETTETANDESIDAETEPEKEAKERLQEFSSAVERLQDDDDCDPGCGC